MERVITYVDGYNLYYGLRGKQWKWFYWLNIQLLAENLVKPDQKLVATKYFTTIVNHPGGVIEDKLFFSRLYKPCQNSRFSTVISLPRQLLVAIVGTPMKLVTKR